MSIAASCFRKRVLRYYVLLVATVTFWGILQSRVGWAFSHPFNPNDGGPRTFAFLFGWLFGIVVFVAPSYWASKGIQCWIRKRQAPTKN